MLLLRFVFIVYGLVFVPSLFGGENPAIQKAYHALSAEKYTDRQEAESTLLRLAGPHQDEVIARLIKGSEQTKDPEVQSRSTRLLRSIYERYVLGIGEAYYGFDLGWFIDRSKTNLSAFPMVLEVEPGGPAEKALFRPGDVITHINGESCRGINARNELVSKLALMRPGQKNIFKVKLSGVQGVYQKYQKGVRKERSLISEARKPATKKLIYEEKAYQKWLSRSRK